MRGRARITLDSVDVSNSAVGKIEIEAEEFTARIADFTIVPASGAIDVSDWTGKPVTIDYITFDSAGATLTDNRIFTGTVDLPVFDPKTGLVKFECTDELQRRFESQSQATTLAELTGFYSEAVFGEAEDGWRFAQDVMSTVPKSFDLNADGVTGVLAAWEGKSTPDFTFDDDVVIDGSVRIELAKKREIHNKNTVSAEYQFVRTLHREHDYSWVIPSWDFCTYYADAHELPNREQIKQAAEGAGWRIQGAFSFGELPDSGSPMCGGSPVVWIIHPDIQDQLVYSAGWTAIKRWTQGAKETYDLIVQAPQSITHFGEIAIESSASLSTDYDDAGWESSEETSTPTSATQDSIGDWFINRDDRTEADNMIVTKLNAVATPIIESHRRNYVTWSVPLTPTVERHHTCYLNTVSYQAKSKVAQVNHSIDISGGEDLTTIRIAVSKTGTSTPPTPDALTAPSPPSTGPVISAPPSSTAMQTQLGGKTGAPVHDTAKDGFSGNYTVQDFGAEVYPHQFKVDTAAIEDDVRDEATGNQSATYNIVIPDELLVINV